MRNHAHARAIDSTRTRGGFICKGVVNGGSEYGEGCAFAASFLLRSVSVALLLSLSPLRLRSVTLRSSSSPLSHFKHCSPFTTYGRPCFSRTIFSSLFDIALALFKDKVRCLCRARARSLPLFALAPSDHSLAFSLSLPLLLSLSPPLNLYTHKDGHDDVTKHVTIV